MHFGEHVTIDGYGGSPDLLDDPEIVRGALDHLVQQLEMRTMAPPLVVYTPGNDEKDPGGWSSVVLIEESHISIHTFPKRRFLSADVYTCRNGLDPAVVADYLRKTFQLEDIEQNFITRGTRYPKENLV